MYLFFERYLRQIIVIAALQKISALWLFPRATRYEQITAWRVGLREPLEISVASLVVRKESLADFTSVFIYDRERTKPTHFKFFWWPKLSQLLGTSLREPCRPGDETFEEEHFGEEVSIGNSEAVCVFI
ncbi:hypothetical protein AVEN_238800-1 [Araneus ventricosus]|uniref:Uncharacterized protein n=1 Tax=Araneus ventricosus TaxID=182803 RepID=A0A4Y2UXQ6_ARAVE|nr:hypothetical protein AVEN_238800-1 [Araneus ventricosus]